MENDLMCLTGAYPNQTHYYYFNNGFSCSECNAIVDEFSSTSKICLIPRKESTQWIYSKFLEMAKSANDSMFHFELTTIMDQIQMAIYDEEDGEKCDYHIDMGSDNKYACRKITMVCQLSDQSTYQGGNFEIMNKGIVSRDQGCVICLPSFLYHRVTPITRGKRYSLVIWICGPPLR